MKSSPDISPLLPDEGTLRARRAALASELRPGAPRRRGPGRAPRLLVAIAALVVLSGGAAFAAGVFSADDVAVDDGIGCYDRPSLRGDVTITHAAADPVAKCARFWREGVVDVDAPPGVPPLVACTGEGRPVGVFPGSGAGVCERLGLVALPTDYAPAGAAHARAYAAFHALGGVPNRSSRCPSPQAQADHARARLASKYGDVEVVIEGDEPCGGGYKLAGERIAVATVPRDRALANRLAAERRGEIVRIAAALDPLFGEPPRYRRTRATCLAPEKFAASVRRALDDAGFRRVGVGVRGAGDCVSTAARYGSCCRTVETGGDERLVATVMAVTRAAWEADRASDRYWKARRSGAEAVPPR